MIDYFLKYADEATAKTALASRVRGGEWPTEYCIAGVTIWRASQDTLAGNGGIVHTPLAGFFILVSLPNIIPALRDLAAVQVVIDRDLALARQAGAVIKSNVTNAILQDMVISPVFAGTDLPYGNMN